MSSDDVRREFATTPGRQKAIVRELWRPTLEVPLPGLWQTGLQVGRNCFSK